MVVTTVASDSITIISTLLGMDRHLLATSLVCHIHRTITTIINNTIITVQQI